MPNDERQRELLDKNMSTIISPSEFYSGKFNPADYPADSKFPARKHVIWLGSFPKSGNTWVRILLAAYLKGSDDVDINEDTDDAVQCNHSYFHSVVQRIEGISQDLPATVAARVKVQRLLARCPRPTLVKTHAYPGKALGHLVLDPDVTAKSLYLVRHPFDVAISFSKHMGKSLDEGIASMLSPDLVLGGAKQPLTPVSSWNNNVIAWQKNQGVFGAKIVRYEDLRSNTIFQFQEILSFLGIPFNQDRLEKAIEITDISRLRTQEKEKGFHEKSLKAEKQKQGFFGEGLVRGWEGKLNEAQLGKLAKNSEEAMKMFGYWEKDFDKYL